MLYVYTTILFTFLLFGGILLGMLTESTLEHIRETYISVTEAAARLGVIPRRVRVLAIDGRIPGAVRISGTWAIPKAFADPRRSRGRPKVFEGPQ
jgi:hypothetical protein